MTAWRAAGTAEGSGGGFWLKMAELSSKPVLP